MKTIEDYNNLDELTAEIQRYVAAKFPEVHKTWRDLPKYLTYLHSEVSEAFEVQKTNRAELKTELADIMIRLLDTIAILEISPEILISQGTWEKLEVRTFGKMQLKNFLEVEYLLYMHWTISKVLEAWRDNSLPDAANYLALLIIMVNDAAGALGIDLKRAILDKMRYNWRRPTNHGRAQV